MKGAPPVILVLLLAYPALSAAAPADSQAADSHPLLEFARERERTRDRPDNAVFDRSAVRDAQHQLQQAKVPPDAECAGSIGAAQFAQLHDDLGDAYGFEGDFLAAAASYRRAHACRPREADFLVALARALFDARDQAGTREAITAALALDPRSIAANRIAGNLDFVEERWADAIARFRYVAAGDGDRREAGYSQLMYWLAQRRAGVARPEFVARTADENWPQPLLLFMRGEYTEADLISPIEAGDSSPNAPPNTSTDERLCEALFYVAEEYWARGQRDVARDYFAALVNIRVLYFLEHGIALAEIIKLRGAAPDSQQKGSALQ